MAPYRAPGRSHRSGRAHADNDVFEGLPVKQWAQQHARISLAPPASETDAGKDDKWGDPPMPRDYQLLQPWTQQLLRLARSGKVGTKRKPDPDALDEDRLDDDAPEEAKNSLDDRSFLARKWKHVPESLLEPEHHHFEFLAKRRKGLPSLYGPDAVNGAVVPMRRTKVQRAGPDGDVHVYEVLVPEGQSIEGEIIDASELADIKPLAAAPGTVIEGVGVANDDGIIVAEHLKPSAAPRRNRPPPKKKGGPGRGKKRVTFTNPDGSTYTKIVPNAMKIVPQPGQTIKHVSKGEEAAADISAEQAAAHTTSHPATGGEEDEGEGEGSEEGEEGEDDDDREEGELSDEDAPPTGQTPAPPAQGEAHEVKLEVNDSPAKEDIPVTDAPANDDPEKDILENDNKDKDPSDKDNANIDKEDTDKADTDKVDADKADTDKVDADKADADKADADEADNDQADSDQADKDTSALPAAPPPDPPAEEQSAENAAKDRDASSSPEQPLAETSHSRQNSHVTPAATAPATDEQANDAEAPSVGDVDGDVDMTSGHEEAEKPGDVDMTSGHEEAEKPGDVDMTSGHEEAEKPGDVDMTTGHDDSGKPEEGEEDLLGSLEKHLEGQQEQQQQEQEQQEEEQQQTEERQEQDEAQAQGQEQEEA